MAYLTQKKFDFRCDNLPQDTFGVVEFKGDEGLSILYRFSILLVSRDPEIDFDSVVQNPASLSIHREKGGDVDFHGILADFQQLHAVGKYAFYRATLVPKLWWLTMTHHNQVFLDQTVVEIAQAVLLDAGLTANDYEFRMEKTYPKTRFVCQYGETHFNFLSRRLERDGIYYFFEQSPRGEKIIFTDTTISQTECTFEDSMRYAPPSGMDDIRRTETIQGFTCRQGAVPAKIRLKDYNYRKPSLPLYQEAVVDDKSQGEVYYYGEHYPSPEEGNRLAKIRAEEITCRKREFNGESTIPCLQPGFTFDLKHHYRDSFNQKYLAVSVTHEGGQTGYLVSGIANGLSDREKEVYYHNRFSAIPANVQFRPPRKTPRPKVNGTLHGRIDAQGSGEYAELDEHGRYKVILPFDLSGREDAKASHWLRMAQPYGGENQGMHFPLHKHTEVLLTFIEGNPDRPIIAAAVPDLESQKSLVTGKNRTKSIIKTGRGPKTHSVGAVWDQAKVGNNVLAIDDDSSNEHIVIHSNGNLSFEARGNSHLLLDDETGYVNYVGGILPDDPDNGDRSQPPGIVKLLKRMYDYDDKAFKPEGCHVFSNFSPTEPVEEYSSGKNYKKGEVVKHDEHYYMCRNEDGTTGEFNPQDWLEQYEDPEGSDKDKWQYLVNRGQVRVARMDSFHHRKGNIYDFGGYWNYNMGNRYMEEHTTQSAKINQELDDDLLAKGGPRWCEKEPAWKSILKDQPRGGSSNDLMDLAHDKSNPWTQIWVDKFFGDYYEYASGSKISIRKGSSQTIQLGGRHIEEWYRGGEGDDNKERLSYRVWEGGKLEEWKYSGRPGKNTLLSYSLHEPDKERLGFHKLNRHFTNISLKEFYDSNKASFSLYAGASASAEIYAAAATSFKFHGDMNLHIDVNPGLLNKITWIAGEESSLKINTSVGLKFDHSLSAHTGLKSHLGGEYLLNLVTLECEGWLGGLRMQKRAALETKLSELLIDKGLGRITDEQFETKRSKLQVRDGTIGMYNLALLYFS